MPSVNINKVPKSSKKKTIGTNQYFLRIIKNSQNSAKIESLDMCDII